MYQIAKNVIASQRFELSSMLAKLDALWLQGDLTDDQRTELVQLAREHADPALSVNVMARIEDHETRLRALEKDQAPAKPEPTTSDEPLATEEFPAYESGKSYRTGDQVTQGGKRYRCNLPEYTLETTWGPADYPRYWQEVA